MTDVTTSAEPMLDADAGVEHGPLPGWLAILLVVGTSAAVLVLEILAGRLLAPYVGVSLNTYTGIIGTVLVGIAIGAWLGGVAADRFDPRRLIPLLLIVGGALAIATIPTVRRARQRRRLVEHRHDHGADVGRLPPSGDRLERRASGGRQAATP